MFDFKEYDQYDGLGLAELIRTGQVSAAEVLEAAVTRIERLNPAINAVVTPLFAFGRRSAALGAAGARNIDAAGRRAKRSLTWPSDRRTMRKTSV